MSEEYYEQYKEAFVLDLQQGTDQLNGIKDKLLNPEDVSEEHFEQYFTFNGRILFDPIDNIPEEDKVIKIMKLIQEGFERITSGTYPNYWPGKDELYQNILNTIFGNINDNSEDAIIQCLLSISYFELLSNYPVQQSHLYSLLKQCFSVENFVNFGSKFLLQILGILMQLISDNSQDPDLRSKSAKTISGLIELFPGLFQREHIIGFFQTVFQADETATTPELFKTIWDIISNLIKYNHQTFIDNPDLVENIKEELCNKLLERLKKPPIDEELNDQNLDAIQQSYQIASILHSFFVNFPGPIFEKIQTFYSENIGEDQWQLVNAALFSIIAICDSSPYDSTIKEKVINYLLEGPFNDEIIHAGENFMNERTKDTALLALSQMVNAYPDLATGNEEIFPLFHQTILNTKNPKIVKPLYCALISLIKCVSPELDQNIIELLNQQIETFDQLPECERPLVCLFASSVFIRNSNILTENEIIFYSLQLLKILQPTLGIPARFCENSQMSEAWLAPFKKINIPEHITGLSGFSEIYQSSIQPENSSSFDQAIWENSLIAICNLMNSKHSDFQYLSLPLFSSIYNAISNAYSHGNESLISTAFQSLGKCFDVMYSIQPDSTQGNEKEAFQIIMTDFYSNFPIELDKDNFVDSVYLSTKLAYYDLLGNFFQFGYPFQDKKINETETIIRTISEYSVSLLSNLPSPEDINNFTEMVLCFFTKIFIGFGSKEQEFLSEWSKDYVFPFINKWKDSQADNLNEKVFNVLLVLIKTMGEKIGKKVNANLNSKSIKGLIKEGKKKWEKKFKGTADQLLKFLETL